MFSNLVWIIFTTILKYVPVDEIFDGASDGDEITITHIIGCPLPIVKSVAVLGAVLSGNLGSYFHCGD